MKKNLIFTIALLLGVFASLFSSCDNEEEPKVAKPIVSLTEVGEENSKTAVAGKDLHLEGELQAEGLIERIELTLTTADKKNTVLAQSWTDGKYIGVRNTLFHEHVDIPTGTPAGDYLLAFTVTDQTGQSCVVTSDLKIEVSAK